MVQILKDNFRHSACTSIVATDQSGRIIQSRNLDYPNPDFLCEMTIQVDFQRDGKV